MSQEKVNKYKEDKKNRKKHINKEKRTDTLISLGIALVIIALCAFIIWSVYATYFKSETKEKTTYKLSAGEISRIIDSHEDKDKETGKDSTEAESSTEEATTAAETTTQAGN